jgi:uncharacterized delta-60 repeat protein
MWLRDGSDCAARDDGDCSGLRLCPDEGRWSLGVQYHALVRRFAAVAVCMLSLAFASSAWGLGAGSLDPTFNAGQPFALDLAQTAPHATGLGTVTVDPSGRYLAAGNTTDSTGHAAVVMTRVLPQGLLDSAFGAGGAEVVQVGQAVKPFSISQGGISLNSSGQPLVGVYANTPDGRVGMGLLRLGENGLPDLGFGSGGSQLVQPASPPAYGSGGAAALAPDGSIYQTGLLESEPSTGANRRLIVAKFDTNGSIIGSYGTGGYRYFNFSQDATDTGTYDGAILPRADGTVLLAGTTLSSDTRQQLYVARIKADGTPDASFGTTGAGYTDVQAREPGSSDSQGQALAVAPDGSIYVAGNADDSGDHQAMSVTRFGAGGALDTTFGSMGTRHLQLGGTGPERRSYANTVLVQPDGKVILIGSTESDSIHRQLAIVRLNTDGSLDTSFGSGGIDLLQFATSTTSVFTYGASAALTPDGKLIIAGTYNTPGEGAVGFLARVLLSPPPASPGGPSTAPTSTPPSPLAAPAITKARQSTATWRAGNKLARVSRKKRPPVGSTFSYVLNEPASVTFRFTQRVAGRKIGRNCVARTHRNSRRKACQRTVTVATLAFAGHVGTNKVVFQGRITRSRTLKPGRYTLLITAANAAGGRSAPAALTFTIVK